MSKNTVYHNFDKLKDLDQPENTENVLFHNFEKVKIIVDAGSGMQIQDPASRDQNARSGSVPKFNHFFRGERRTLPHNLVQS